MSEDKALGTYLRSRRTQLDALALGYSGRRRTAGLRREEVADRASISATWYTWLEQGRGGKPSAEVLDRIAQALMLTDVEREHLFVLGLGHPPEQRYRGGDPITPRLQRLLDALPHSPALLRTPTWDIVAWNRAARAVLTDYETIPPQGRNVLRMMFCDPHVRERQFDWEAVARAVVAAARVDAARAGADAEIAPLVAELRAISPEFGAMWDSSLVHSHTEGVKRLRHPRLGEIALEYSSFAVEGRKDLSLIVYNPATEQDRERILSVIGDV
ncbi:helix-turn-helix domain-containing protein [Ramlibacter sp. G-1-2-2]|uniref:Helix-turn-helix domain-containing protein n=1 Tax=Ramlibacter agri TaxID=2728837 RepID=A0A848H4S7_9BURK|nr:helix-turn-helix transcriptional regulator [Ramlibacter agri]NML44519.1 helix-turn-helix domain-containing protein [Ramlibacter agri]